MNNLFVFVAGFFFSLGISESGMINPSKVLDFLDVAGNWDPTLLVVMCSALGVTLITFRHVLRLPKPMLHSHFILPTLVKVDRPLLIGQILFGIGWGIVGYCPGPIFSSLALGSSEPVLVLLGIIGGVLLHKIFNQKA